MTEHWRPAAPTTQSIEAAVVFGNVFQISDVHGDVRISATSPPYRLDPRDDPPRSVPIEQARAQPSRLLLARNRVVPFGGRAAELADLSDWLDDASGVAVRLVHAAGGHGKTRFADHVGSRCTDAGWTVWRVTHAATVSSDQSRLPFGGGLLAVVDYADRWPVPHLLLLVDQLRQLHRHNGTTVRVLLLGRSPRWWWNRVADRLDSTDAIPATVRALGPLGDRDGLFREAFRCFADAMGAGELTVPPAPAELAGAAFASILDVHMAALVAVDAARRGATAATTPYALSRYLLEREATHWHELHSLPEGASRTSPGAMGRAAYLATLTGPVPYAVGRAVLLRASVTDPGPDTILDDHRFCYPSPDPRTVLQPLYPDRLGEDFLALTTPGHPYGNVPDGWEPDPWATSAARDLLASEPPGGEPRDGPSWAPAAIAVLVETGRRWEHIVSDVLNPLLADRPELALAGGGAVLSRLAELPGIEPGVLAGIEAMLPAHGHVGLDAGAAAITTALTRQLGAHLALTRPEAPGLPAAVHHVVAFRLQHAGDLGRAIEHAEESVARHREQADSDETAPARLVLALNLLASCLEADRRTDQAEPVAREALTIARSLPADHHARRSLLATALCTAGWANRDSDPAAAVRWCEEGLTLVRDLADAEPDDHRSMLGIATTRLGVVLGMAGDRKRDRELAGEAVDLLRDAATSEPDVYLPDLAAAWNNLAAAAALVDEDETALRAAEQGADCYRRLSAVNPLAYRPYLAVSLVNFGMRQNRLGRSRDAIDATGEAAEILRPLAAGNGPAYQGLLATALDQLTVAELDLGRLGAALESAKEAVAAHRAKPEAQRDDAALALALIQLDMRYGMLGRFEEAVRSARDADEIADRLRGQNRLRLRSMAAQGVAMVLFGARRYTEAKPAMQRAVTVCREGDPAELAYILYMSAMCDRYAGTDLADAIVALQESIDILERLDGGYLPNLRGAPVPIREVAKMAEQEYIRVLHASGRSDEALALAWRPEVRRAAGVEPTASRMPGLTLSRLASRWKCPVETARARLVRSATSGYVRASRSGRDGPLPADLATIAGHARFTLEEVWPWQQDRDSRVAS